MTERIKQHRGAILMALLLLAVRLLAMAQLGPDHWLASDDGAYLTSGVHWAQTGVLTMHGFYPSAQIMPGYSVLVGLIYLVTGTGDPLWLGVKLVNAAMGALTGLYLYRTVALFVPRWCGLLAMAALLRPDMVWMDNLALTETPFMLALSAMIYYALRMGRDRDWKSFWCCLLSWLCGLMLKANIGIFPLIALVYLLCTGYDKKLLVKQCLTLGAVSLCILVPWTVRNHQHFDAFIPLTCGAGNPTLLGTYQGYGYPADEELDYETNVDAVVREKYKQFYKEDGTLQEEYAYYVGLRADGIKARYRQQVWWDRDPLSMLISYLVLKPARMVFAPFYWVELFGVSRPPLIALQLLDALGCAAALVLACRLDRRRAPMLFLAGTYLVNLYVYAMTYSFSRYNASMMGLRFCMLAIGLGILYEQKKEAVR